MKKILIAILFATMTLGSIPKLSWSQQQPVSEAERRKLILQGARLWAIYCNQCHNARTPGEKAPYEWDIEIMHMHSLGNMPPEVSKALLEYLKAK